MILASDMPRAYKKFGLLHPEPHMAVLLKLGGFNETDEKVDYVVYSQQLES